MKVKYPFFLMFAAVLMMSACSNDTASTPQTTEPGTTPDTTEIQNAVKYTLPEYDFNGASFTIYGGEEYADSFVEEEVGEPLNDAKFRMARTVEEAYHVKIDEFIVPFWGMNDGIRQLILAGDTTYDAYATMDMYAIPLTLEGCFVPLQNVESIRISEPWWGEDLTRELTVANNLFYAVASINMRNFSNTSCLLMNKRIADSLNIEIPYDDVFAGTWTIDDFLAYRGLATKDLDGNGVMDINDAYTYGTSDIRRHEQWFWFGFGGKYVDKDQDDIPHVTIYDNEKYLKSIELVYGMVYSGPDRISHFMDLDNGSLSTKFNEGNIFVTPGFFQHISSAREMQDDFAVLPLPKYDESQARYYSWVDDPTFYMIPTTQDDVEYSGAVLDALACVAHYDVLPALIETTLKDKASRDEQTKEIIDLCFASRTIEFGESAMFDYFDAAKTCSKLMRGVDNVTSTLEKERKRIEKQLENIIKDFEKLS